MDFPSVNFEMNFRWFDRIRDRENFLPCSYFYYFIQVYVTNPPLPFPVGTIIRLTVSALMGGALSIIYIYTLLKSPPPKSNIRKSVARKVSWGWGNDKPFLQMSLIFSLYFSQGTSTTISRRKTQVTEEDLMSLRAKFRSSFQVKN